MPFGPFRVGIRVYDRLYDHGECLYDSYGTIGDGRMTASPKGRPRWKSMHFSQIP